MITTYDSNCLKCLNGSLHPFHDNGTPAEVAGTPDDRFSQLPSERRRTKPCRCVGCGHIHSDTTGALR